MILLSSSSHIGLLLFNFINTYIPWDDPSCDLVPNTSEGDSIGDNIFSLLTALSKCSSTICLVGMMQAWVSRQVTLALPIAYCWLLFIVWCCLHLPCNCRCQCDIHQHFHHQRSCSLLFHYCLRHCGSPHLQAGRCQQRTGAVDAMVKSC